MKKLKNKIIIFTFAAFLLSCNTTPNYSSNQSWMIKSSRKRTWATMTILGVHIERSGGWSSIEREVASLAPLYFWRHGCKVVPAEEKPKFAARIYITERDIDHNWNSKKSLAIDVHVWFFEDAHADGAPVMEHRLPAAVGRIIRIGRKSFTSSETVSKLLSKAVAIAARRLYTHRNKKNA